MKKIFVLIGLMSLIFGIVFTGCTEQISPEQIAKKMEEKYNSIEDMSGKMVMTIDVQGKSETMYYNYKYKKPNKYVYENDEILMISDGKTMYVYNKKQNQYTKTDVFPQDDVDYYGSVIKTKIVKDMLNIYDIELLGSEKVSDKDCYILKLTSKNKTGVAAPKNMKIWVDKEYWQPLKIEMSEDEFKIVVEYRDVKFNTGISDDEFKFTPPKDAKSLKDTATIEEYKMPKEMTIEEAQKEIEFKILVPKYTAGYGFKSAIVNNQTTDKIVILQYLKDSKPLMIVELKKENKTEIPNAEKVKIAGIEGEYIESIGSKMLAFNKDGIRVMIMGQIDKDELIKIAESMIEN
jgi:outer membrane lipoprotein-sorting protein